MTLFDRYIAVQVINRVFNLTEFDIEFKVKGAITTGTSPTAASAEIKIFNLAQGSLGQFKNGAIVTLDAGYAGTHSQLFYGVIDDVMQERSKGDVATLITLLDGLETIGNLDEIVVKYPANTSYDTMATDVIQKAGISLAKSESYGGKSESAITLKGTPRKILKELISRINGDIKRMDPKSKRTWKFFMVNGQGYWVPSDFSSGNVFTLTSESGLLAIAKADSKDRTEKKGLRIDMLLNARIQAGSFIVLDDKTGEAGSYQVVAVSHQATKSEFKTTAEVTAI